MDCKTVLDLTNTVISTNAKKIFLFSQTGGGWEIWLQCEFSALAADKGHMHVREHPAWGDGRAADLFFSNPDLAVEFKCLGWNVIQKSYNSKTFNFGSIDSLLTAFAERVVEDQQKLSELKNTSLLSIAVIPKFDGTEKIVTTLCTKYSYEISAAYPFFVLFWKK